MKDVIDIAKLEGLHFKNANPVCLTTYMFESSFAAGTMDVTWYEKRTYSTDLHRASYSFQDVQQYLEDGIWVFVLNAKQKKFIKRELHRVRSRYSLGYSMCKKIIDNNYYTYKERNHIKKLIKSLQDNSNRDISI